MQRAKQYLKKCLRMVAVVMFCYGLCELFGFGLRLNTSDSLPFYFFISQRVNQNTYVQNESYVALIHYLSDTKLAKQVAGVAGEPIRIDNGTLFVADRIVGIVIEKDSLGNPLNPISETVIPEEFLFVRGTHPRSFDSRYAEFGLVSIDQVVEVLWPLF